MSSAGKTLHSSDVTTLPYVANKEVVAYSANMSGKGYTSQYGNTTSSLDTYKTLTNLFYNQQAYSQSVVKPISQMTSTELFDYQAATSSLLSKLYYVDIDQSTAASGTLDYTIKNITTASAAIRTLSIPQMEYGEKLKEQTFAVEALDRSYYIIDDGNGNLIDLIPYLKYLSGSSYTASFDYYTGSALYSTNIIYDALEYANTKVYVYSSSVFNFSSSYNPSYVTYTSSFGPGGYIGATQSYYSGSNISSSILFTSSSLTGSLSASISIFRSSNTVGNIFYAQGIVSVTNPHYMDVLAFPTATPTPTPTATPTPTPTPTLTPTPTPTVTPTPTTTPTPTPTPLHPATYIKWVMDEYSEAATNTFLDLNFRIQDASTSTVYLPNVSASSVGEFAINISQLTYSLNLIAFSNTDNPPSNWGTIPYYTGSVTMSYSASNYTAATSSYGAFYKDTGTTLFTFPVTAYSNVTTSIKLFSQIPTLPLPTPTPTPTATPTPTPTPTATPTSTPTPTPTATPTSTPTPTPTIFVPPATATPTPTPTPFIPTPPPVYGVAITSSIAIDTGTGSICSKSPENFVYASQLDYDNWIQGGIFTGMTLYYDSTLQNPIFNMSYVYDNAWYYVLPINSSGVLGSIQGVDQCP